MNDGEDPSVETILMLPDDLLLNCLARVSRSYYPTLSLVCNKFHSILASTELGQTRVLLGCTQSCLYVCLRLRTDSKLLRWFILGQRQNSSRKVLVPILSPNITSAGVAVVGPNIYAIGGGIRNNTSSSVMVMDSRSHTWREAPSMRVARKFPSVCTLDGKIYVMGGCDNLDSTNWMEVFDTNTQTWEFLQIPSEEICGGSNYESVRYEGTVYVWSEAKNVTYKLHEDRWSVADMYDNKNRTWGWLSSSYCVIENVFYCFLINKIRWYEPKERAWATLKGLEGLPTLPCNGHVLLADYGGKMLILWEEYVVVKEKKMIWCAEITIEKRQNGEIWGTLEWFDNVFMSNGPNGLMGLAHALSTTVW
ncbi:PREDICTED: putative F-box/kelch-repeat protein At4g34170 [Camelina sativa]|uniref:F-box/kelch-repeat protein At4g34170 n=1 Tax=Camelina sativa TaxID=90675 RepID=A0ABM0UVW9_CAMSA|nr:PREDICTED: putative F-box/kelch-repeat protein At4g34170 [Camelina sativa]